MPAFWCYLINVIYLVALVVLVLATARLIWLFWQDDITMPLRLWIDRKWGTDSFLSRLIWCPWCLGMWMSGFTNAYALTAAALWCGMNVAFAAACWLPLTLAVGFSASWIVEKVNNGLSA